MRCVVDASFALAMILPDEASPSADVMAKVLGLGISVPSHWPIEVANGCLMALRRGRLSEDECVRVMGDLAALMPEVSQADMIIASSPVMGLARQHGLSMYDAGYLELAARRQCALATHDRALRRAASAIGLHVI